ncbi:MAG: tRNA (adenosine(37)-N6)-threonylcarbamoyltransferase complex dimerization subunit type 1 TsaB [Bacteroidales bacterium]
MALILNIETSTTVCSVALAKNGIAISKRENHDEKSHAKTLTIYIDEVLKEAKVNYNQLDAIAVSKGPGSYTGLRIGVSVGKGLCYALNKPLIAVNTLQLMCLGLINKVNSGEVPIENFSSSYLLPMIDARRMEVYTALYSSDAKVIKDVSAEIITPESYKEILDVSKIVCFGNGAFKASEIIKHPNFKFIPDIFTLAQYMTEISEEFYLMKKFEDIAYFEPFYLKDFVATVPKKNIFN